MCNTGKKMRYGLALSGINATSGFHNICVKVFKNEPNQICEVGTIFLYIVWSVLKRT